MLPLFYEYSRRLRQGVLSWVDEHPGWRLVEMDPREQTLGRDLTKYFSGVITWVIDGKDSICLTGALGVPVIDCGLAPVPSGFADSFARVTFDRGSISDLAIRHFHELGVEVAGYVGSYLRPEGLLADRAMALRTRALNSGMEWVEHDLDGANPTQHLDLLWNGASNSRLAHFLKTCPKPVGLLAEDDYVGVMLCETALKLGLKVPGELLVLGQGDRVLGRSGTVTLSSVAIPGYDVGRTAAEMLDGWMKTGRPPSSSLRMLPCREIVVRESTGGLSRDLGIERAKRYMELNAVKGATLGELASIAGCSVKTLRSKFARIYGIGITENLRDLRRASALKLLAESDLEINEIAARCGFISASNFFNFVKRQSGGLGPAEYRRTHQSPQANPPTQGT